MDAFVYKNQVTKRKYEIKSQTNVNYRLKHLQFV